MTPEVEAKLIQLYARVLAALEDSEEKPVIHDKLGEVIEYLVNAHDWNELFILTEELQQLIPDPRII